jgi:hypothetical protein
MEPNVVAVDMLVNESKFFSEQKNEEKVEKLVTIPSSYSKMKIIWE